MINDQKPSLASKVMPAMMKLASRPRSRVATIALRVGFAMVLFVALLQLRVYLPDKAQLHQWKWNPEFENPQRESETDHVCSPFTGFERVVITVKTGATEASQRIPVQLRTTLQCAPHVYIFSDMAQMIGNVEVYDALDETADEVKHGNTDFDIYRKQQELKDPAKIVAQLKSMKSPGSNELAAWTLDKYKNIHIVEKTWELRPGMDWYLHIDADTYVIWPSLIEWLRRLDKKKDLFLGSTTYINDNPFAHGGSGILMSGVAMRTLADENNGTAARWDPEVHNNCCGDYLLAQALKEYEIGPVKNSWPTINGESQNTIPFGDEHWCQPVVTMHHVSTDEMEEMVKFEEKRPKKSVRATCLSKPFPVTLANILQKPLTYEELFNGVVANKFPDTRKHWDNLSEGEVIKDVESADHCIQLCIADESCLQSRYDGNQCNLGTKTVVMGQQKYPDGEQVWQSYWNTTRIKKWVRNRKPCGALEFPHQR